MVPPPLHHHLIVGRSCIKRCWLNNGQPSRCHVIHQVHVYSLCLDLLPTFQLQACTRANDVVSDGCDDIGVVLLKVHHQKSIEFYVPDCLFFRLVTDNALQ